MVTLITDQLYQSSLEDPVSSERQLVSKNFNFRTSPASGRLSVTLPAERLIFQNTPITFQAAASEASTAGVDASCDPLGGSLFKTNVSAAQTFSPTEVPPAAKRHRRSASIPGGSSPTESRIQKRTSRHRQSVAIIRPSVIHPDLFLAEVKQQLPRSGTDSTCTLDNSHSRVDSAKRADCPAGPPFTFSGLKCPQSASVDCSLDAATGESPSSKPLSFSCDLHWSTSCAFACPLTEQKTVDDQSLQRCQSQPSVFLTRIGSLKRRRDEEITRPRLDFQKMRQTAFMGSETTLHPHSQITCLHNLHYSPVDTNLPSCSSHDVRHFEPPRLPSYESQHAVADKELSLISCAQTDTVLDNEQVPPTFADLYSTAGNSDSSFADESSSDDDDMLPTVVGITDEPAGRHLTENRRNSIGDENSGFELLFGGEIDLDLIENN